mgnify:CR=1 FL=1
MPDLFVKGFVIPLLRNFFCHILQYWEWMQAFSISMLPENDRNILFLNLYGLMLMGIQASGTGEAVNQKGITAG